ncbi:MAG: Maf family protein, partial [Eubacterium sp.]|nr:Maf family protein [Eubacterium sp.]
FFQAEDGIRHPEMSRGLGDAYKIQGKGALLVEKIDGDYFNVVGLPISTLNKHL